MRAVTVVLPLVPVTAITGTRRNRKASSVSLTTGMPRRSASRIRGWKGGTPGEGTTRSWPATTAAAAPPVKTRSGSPSRAPSASRSSASGLSSVAVTAAPRPAAKRDAAIPVFPRPMTRICLPFSSTRCPYLSFSVLMATRARMIEMIQNRTMTFGSAHPFSSKW